MFNIVLYQPEIPQNTGNIARTCSVTNARLHIIRPMGFEIDDKKLKRAGLDYWHFLDITYYDSADDFFAKNSGETFYFCSTKAPHCYSDVSFKDGDFLIFGKETAGLPEDMLVNNIDNCIRIPMQSQVRSLNLSNSVAIVLYEALRQTNFKSLQQCSDYLGEKYDF